jgi:hypothetical protein
MPRHWPTALPRHPRSEAASEHHDIDVGGQHEHAHPRSDTAREARTEFTRRLVTGVGGVEDIAHRMRGTPRPPLGDHSAAGERLDAAALTAAAPGPRGIDRDMADLAGGAARTAPHLAVRHDAGRHAGAEIEVSHRRRGAPLLGAQGVGAEGCGLDVVLDPHRHAQVRRDRSHQIELLHAEVDGVHHAVRPRFDLAGDADAHRSHVGQRHTRFGAEGANRVQHGLGHGIRSPPGGDAHSPYDPARPIDGDGVGLRATDVESDLHRPPSIEKAARCLAPISP